MIIKFILLCYKEAEIVERHLRPDHVHMCLRVPPKYAASNVVGYLKGKSMIMIARFFIREGTVLKHQDSHSAGGGQGVLPVSLPKHDTWRGGRAFEAEKESSGSGGVSVREAPPPLQRFDGNSQPLS